jgi:ATP-dependent DNA helicase RecG
MSSLASIIRRGTLYVDVMPEPSALGLAETLVAFANTEGGTVLLGVDEKGEIRGGLEMEDVDNVLRGALAWCRPIIRTDIDRIEDREGMAVAIVVAKGNELFSLADGRFLARTAEGNAPMDARRVMLMAASKASLDYEQEVVPGVTFDDLDPKVIDDYMTKRQERVGRKVGETANDVLRSLGAITLNGEITVVGILLFGTDPQAFLPQSGITYVRFSGKEPQSDHVVRKDFTGPLASMIFQCFDVLTPQLIGAVSVRGLTRTEHYMLPVDAIREALVNAVSHREYQIRGRRVEVRQFEDRLEIISPGSLPAYITLDNMVEEHFSRNSRIVRGLYHWKLIEELGLGVDRIYSLMAGEGHPQPEFQASRDTVTVTLRRGVGTRPPLRFAGAEDERLNERQIRAIQFLRQNARITNKDLRDLCPEVGAETLRLDMADLVDKGMVIKIGDKRGTFYMLKLSDNPK